MSATGSAARASAVRTSARVPHSRPLLGRAEEEAAVRVLRSGRLAPGAEAERAEALLARRSGCRGAVLLSSGTTALTIALRALGIGPRARVAIPSYACEALLHAVRATGARPIVCDVDPESLALDPAEVARRGRAAEARAVVVVHPFGRPVPVDAYHRRDRLVVEDCAQAIGASQGGAPVGSRGDAAVFSFGPTKLVTCGGPGGGLASSRVEIVAGARDLAGHDEKDDDRVRVNGLMGDLHAAVAAVQLERLDEFRARRHAIARMYDAAFDALGLERTAGAPGTDPILYRYLVRVSDAGALIDSLVRRGIDARRPVYRPLHGLVGARGRYPNTERAQRTLVSLPLYPALSREEVDRTIDEVRRCLS